GRVRHGPGMRTYRILGMRDGDDAGAARQTDRRLERYDSVRIAGADDAAVRLGPERHRSKVRRCRSARARAGAAGVAVDAVRVVRLSAAARPAAHGVP